MAPGDRNSQRAIAVSHDRHLSSRRPHNPAPQGWQQGIGRSYSLSRLRYPAWFVCSCLPNSRKSPRVPVAIPTIFPPSSQRRTRTAAAAKELLSKAANSASLISPPCFFKVASEPAAGPVALGTIEGPGSTGVKRIQQMPSADSEPAGFERASRQDESLDPAFGRTYKYCLTKLAGLSHAARTRHRSLPRAADSCPRYIS